MKKILFLLIFISLNLMSFSQTNLIKWKVSKIKCDNDSCAINISANIAKHWYLYGINIEDGGPLPLLITLENQDGHSISGAIYDNSKTQIKYDDFFKINIETISEEAKFEFVFAAGDNVENLILIIDGQICNSVDGKCMAIYEKIEIEN